MQHTGFQSCIHGSWGFRPTNKICFGFPFGSISQYSKSSEASSCQRVQFSSFSCSGLALALPINSVHQCNTKMTFCQKNKYVFFCHCSKLSSRVKQMPLFLWGRMVNKHDQAVCFHCVITLLEYKAPDSLSFKVLNWP